MGIEFELLGEVRARVDGVELSLGGPRQKSLLARLLVARNQLVARDRLVEDLYGSSRSGAKALQVGIARLRRSLDRTRNSDLMPVVSRDGGYVLIVGPGELDVERFERALEAAEEALETARAKDARSHLASAVALCRGLPLEEFAGAPWAQGEIARLGELRLRALELRAETELRLGAHESAIAELEQLAAHHPARERTRELLMLAQYRAGRQADALSTYREARRHLVEEHGIEPGQPLRDLQQAILLQDPMLSGQGAVGQPLGSELPTGDRATDGEGAQPFVGRVSECAALDAALRRCGSGQRVAALISGEPGIGKTRLAALLGERARAAGFEVLLGRCDNDLDLPFKPFVEVLSQLLTSASDDGLRSHVRAHQPVLARLLPPLAVDVAAPSSEDSVPLPSASTDPQGLQYALFAAVAGLLHEASTAQPLLVVLEDLHWADGPSLLLLKHLLTTPAQPRLMILGTYRSSDLATGHPLKDLLADLHREPGVLRLELMGLLDTEVGELVGMIVGDRGALKPLTVRELRRSTDGNPFFVTEVTRAMIERGDEIELMRSDDPLDDRTLPLPLSIRETVSHRLTRLGEQATDCLSAASILGVTFDSELVPEILELPAQSVMDAFEAALSAGVLDEAGDQMSFRHALIAQTLYESVPARRRRALHRHAAEALERRAATGVRLVPPAAIARQWLHADVAANLEQALRWVRRAGDDAISRLAPQDAQRWYRQALSLNDSRSEPSDEDRCELLIALGTAQQQSGDAAFRDTLLDAARIAHMRRDGPRLVRAALANTRGYVSATGSVDEERISVLEDAVKAAGDDRTATRARLLATLAGELSFTGDWQRRTQLSDEAVAIARETGDPLTLVRVLGPRNVTIWSPSSLADRLVNTAECCHAAYLLDDPLAQFEAVYWRTIACIESGAFTEAAECRQRGRLLTERLRQPTLLWLAAYDRANEAIIVGDLDRADRLANEAFAVGQASGQPDALLILVAQLIAIRYEQGRLGEMIDLVRQGLEHSPRVTGLRAALALGYCEDRRYDEAAALLLDDAEDDFVSLPYDLTWLTFVSLYAHVAARLAPIGAVPLDVLATLRGLLAPWEDQVVYPSAGAWGLVQHYLGMLELPLGDPAAAARRLQHAVRRAERLPAPVWAAHSRLELARALIAADERGRAEQVLRELCREAEPLGCATIARDAGELLADATLGGALLG